MYLLDTDVLSLTSPTSALDTGEVQRWRDWVGSNQEALYFSVITLMEVRFGLEKLQAKGATAKCGRLKKWLLLTETIYRHRTIPVSSEIAHLAGAFLHNAARKGMAPGAEDALIAATAQVADLRLVSRYNKHMAALGVDCLDPLRALPDL